MNVHIAVIDSLAFLFSALLLAGMRGSYRAIKNRNHDSAIVNEERKKESGMARSIRMRREGIAYCRESFWGSLVGLRAHVGFQYGALEVLVVSFAETLPGNSTINLSLLYVSLGLGSFIGPIAGTRSPTLSQTQYSAIVGQFINLIGVGGMGIANTLLDTTWSVCAFNVVRASGGKISGVNSRILLNRLASNEMMGRVMGIDFSIFIAACLALSLIHI